MSAARWSTPLCIAGVCTMASNSCRVDASASAACQPAGSGTPPAAAAALPSPATAAAPLVDAIPSVALCATTDPAA